MSNNDAAKAVGCMGMLFLTALSFALSVLTITVGYGVSVVS